MMCVCVFMCVCVCVFMCVGVCVYVCICDVCEVQSKFACWKMVAQIIGCASTMLIQ